MTDRQSTTDGAVGPRRDRRPFSSNEVATSSRDALLHGTAMQPFHYRILLLYARFTFILFLRPLRAPVRSFSGAAPADLDGSQILTCD